MLSGGIQCHMRWTEFFIPTTKETPHDAVAASHRLMIRSGMIRQVVAGAYTYLPLGLRVLRNVEQIVREEMNAAGAIELNMPAMHPVEWWEQTGRVEAMGEVLLRLQGRGDDWRTKTVLGPTAEEPITEIARAYITSYKQLPINFYQIQTKFRGEARPKSGVLRTREFLMKDAYSFHAAKQGPGGLDETYDRMYQAYCNIFRRCGLPYIVVEAESGAIGGDASHEFMVVTDGGEDFLARSQDGSYAANLERAEVAPIPDAKDGKNKPLAEVHTPGHATIDEVSSFLGCAPDKLIKTIIYEADGGHGVALATGQWPVPQVLVALVRGDHNVNEGKLRRVAGVTSLAPAVPDLIREVTGAQVGFAGPVGLEARIIADQAVTVMHDAVTGANRTDYHVTGVNPGRDFEIKESGDIRDAVEGDLAPNGSPLIFEKCIEVGHVFKLGTKYSEAMGANFVDEDGESNPMIMGCYGIGINRIVAAAIEAGHDDAGIIWPASIAPFSVEICALCGTGDSPVMVLADKLHGELQAKGVKVLLDDRNARPGFKFKDADLIGCPIRITIGKRGLKSGTVEVSARLDGNTVTVAPDEAVTTALALLNL